MRMGRIEPSHNTCTYMWKMRQRTRDIIDRVWVQQMNTKTARYFQHTAIFPFILRVLHICIMISMRVSVKLVMLMVMMVRYNGRFSCSICSETRLKVCVVLSTQSLHQLDGRFSLSSFSLSLSSRYISWRCSLQNTNTWMQRYTYRLIMWTCAHRMWRSEKHFWWFGVGFCDLLQGKLGWRVFESNSSIFTWDLHCSSFSLVISFFSSSPSSTFIVISLWFVSAYDANLN